MSARKLLFPFSMLYGTAVSLRNKLYDSNILKSKTYNEAAVICVGNLNVGGTGKSPMVEYLLNFLKDNYQVATLSRGYKRAGKGFYLLKGNEHAKMVGDEPLQFKTKFPDIMVTVDEDRQNGISNIFKLAKPDVIILDDAFQHRKVTAGLNVLLTAYNNLYVDDLLLPAGNLRESKKGASRANIIVVTKCPKDITEAEMNRIKLKLNLKAHQSLYFSSIKYAPVVKNVASEVALSSFKNSFTLVTGIANPKPLETFLKEQRLKFEHLEFPDHHHFSSAEIEKLNAFDTILTTEKDYMRLKDSVLADKLFYLPIEVGFLKNQETFNSEIEEFVKKMR